MSTTGFNLVTDAWIPVGNGLASIEEALIGAHELDGWPCSDPAFAEALIRLLVPMVYRITRMDDPSLTRHEFADRQEELLSAGQLDPMMVGDYTSRFHDQFWLTKPPEGLVAFGQDPTLAIAKADPPSRGVMSWASGNAPLMGPHAPQDLLPIAAAAQQLLVMRLYSGCGTLTPHPATKKPRGYGANSVLRNTISVHPMGNNFATTLLGHLVPLPHDTSWGMPFWEAPYTPGTPRKYQDRAGFLEQIAVRHDKAYLLRPFDSLQFTSGITVTDGPGVNQELHCKDPYLLTRPDLSYVRPREGREFWREVESLVSQAENWATAEILEWARDFEGGGSYYSSSEFSWAVVTHRGDASKPIERQCRNSIAPDLLAVFRDDVPLRCNEFFALAKAAEQLMVNQVSKTFRNSQIQILSRQSKPEVVALVRAPARSLFWIRAERTFWSVVQSQWHRERVEHELRQHALAGYDEATARLLHDRRSHRAVVESRRWLQRWNRHQDPTAYERQEAS